MNRTKKIQLLNDIRAGKKNIENDFPKESMVIFFHTDGRIVSGKGKKYTEVDIIELEKTKTLTKVQFLDARRKET